MIVKNGKVIFSTGKELPAYCGVIGLSDKLEVCAGFDSILCDVDTIPLSCKEATELSEYMIDLWLEFKNGAAR